MVKPPKNQTLVLTVSHRGRRVCNGAAPVLAAMLLSLGLQLLPVRATAQDTAVQVVEIVPIVTEFDNASPVAPQWMTAFADYAGRFWRKTSNRKLALQFQTGAEIPWRRCETCKLSAFDGNTLAPWLVQLSERQARTVTAPDAYLLLAPSGAIDGAGFYIPEPFLASNYGVAGFDLMAASGPQAALHEIGHFLALPDRYDPHGEGPRALTLMGWIDDPVAPLDPILRADQDWVEVRTVEVERDPVTKSLYPEDVIRIASESAAGAFWLGFQPIPGVDGPNGWMFEIDWSGPDQPFERIEQHLLSLHEPQMGEVEIASADGIFDIVWRFVVDTPRIVVTVRADPLHTVERPPSMPSGCAVAGANNGSGGWLLVFLVIPVWQRMRRLSSDRRLTL